MVSQNLKTYIRVCAFRNPEYSDKTENFRPDYVGRTIALPENSKASKTAIWNRFCAEFPNHEHRLLDTISF